MGKNTDEIMRRIVFDHTLETSGVQGLWELYNSTRARDAETIRRLTGNDHIKQAAHIVAAICSHMQEGGSFRHLIYGRMGFDERAYVPLCEAGGLVISNMCPVASSSSPERIGSTCLDDPNGR